MMFNNLNTMAILLWYYSFILFVIKVYTPNGLFFNTHHGDVPGAYLCEVSHQVLP